MKKYLLFIIITLVSVSGFPQAKFGIKAGVNFSTFTGTDKNAILTSEYETETFPPEGRTGFIAGIFFSPKKLSEYLSIRFEALYIEQGAEYSINYLGNKIKLTCSLNYIEIPVLLKFDIPVENASLVPYIYGGPSLGFNIKSKQKLEISNISTTADAGGITKSLQIGLPFGAGLSFPAGNYYFSLDFRYSLYLSSWSSKDGDILNNSVALTAALTF